MPADPTPVAATSSEFQNESKPLRRFVSVDVLVPPNRTPAPGSERDYAYIVQVEKDVRNALTDYGYIVQWVEVLE